MSGAARPLLSSATTRIRRGGSQAEHGVPAQLRRRIVVTLAVLATFNIVLWLLVAVSASRYGLLLGLAPLAYGFGLRHAIDPDHIAAIDSTTRKLMQSGQRPVGVGLFFSLGHSTVVFTLSVLVALSASYVKRNLPHMQSLGATIGTSVSGGFLLFLAAANLVVFADVYRTWRGVSLGRVDATGAHQHVHTLGLLTRLLRPVLRMVTRSRHMYLIGLLFGLGFDTASEVGLLGMSATAGSRAMPACYILLLPLLFVAGMALVDTADGVAMLGAYGWAFIKPARKLYYNMAITLLSVIVALGIGGLEVFQVVGTETSAPGGLWRVLSAVPFERLGGVVIALFLVSWGVSVLVYRRRNGRGTDEMQAVRLVSTDTLPVRLD